MKSERAISIAKCCVMASFLDRETKQMVIEALSQVDISKTETTSDPCKWVAVKNGRGGHECSFCHEYAPSYQNGTEWLSCCCPNCGQQLKWED